MALLTKLHLFVEAGGVTSMFIVVAGVVMVVISIERFFYLFMNVQLRSSEAIKTVRDLVMSRNYQQAMQICNQYPTYPELTVMRACMANVDAGREAMRSALSYSLIRVNERCEARLAYLALIASAATMLGLLGTIGGLIRTFSGIAAADPGEKAKLLGAGIAEAMNSTAGGLVVGVLAMVMHTVCIARADKINAKAQTAGLGLWTWIEQAERVKKNG